jgi:hypothetical protein
LTDQLANCIGVMNIFIQNAADEPAEFFISEKTKAPEHDVAYDLMLSLLSNIIMAIVGWLTVLKWLFLEELDDRSGHQGFRICRSKKRYRFKCCAIFRSQTATQQSPSSDIELP